MMIIYYCGTSLVPRFDFDLLDPPDSIDAFVALDVFEWRLDLESSLGVPLCDPENTSRAESFFAEERFLSRFIDKTNKRK